MTRIPAAARPSASPPSPTARGFALTGPSAELDPDFAAWRRDLADIALAGRIIASHYAEPLPRRLIEPALVRAAASDEAEVVGRLAPGDPFDMLDCTAGWAWGYAGPERRVGYVRAEAIGS